MSGLRFTTQLLTTMSTCKSRRGFGRCLPRARLVLQQVYRRTSASMCLRLIWNCGVRTPMAAERTTEAHYLNQVQLRGAGGADNQDYMRRREPCAPSCRRCRPRRGTRCGPPQSACCWRRSPAAPCSTRPRAAGRPSRTHSMHAGGATEPEMLPVQLSMGKGQAENAR